MWEGRNEDDHNVCVVFLSEKDNPTQNCEERRVVGEANGDIMRMCRLRWHGLVERKGNTDLVYTVHVPS